METVTFARNSARNTIPFLSETKHINGCHIQVKTATNAFVVSMIRISLPHSKVRRISVRFSPEH